MDLASLIESFATGTYTVTRRARAAQPFVRGIAQSTTNSTVTIRGSVQPASGKDLLRLPEGRRVVETRTLFTTTKLYTGGQGATHEADLVTIDGDSWEVQHVESWVQAAAGGTGTAYRCLLQAPNPQGGP